MSKGYDKIVFSTGTDEHGYKIQKRAAEEKTENLAYCTKISNRFRELFHQCDIKYTDYIRTTEQRHKVAVENFWNVLFKRGFIYKSTYNGWYSMNDEAFLNDDQVEEKLDSKGNKVKVSKESGHAVEYTSESNYIFRLSQFKNQLRQYIEKNVVVPVNYSYALHSQIDQLEDLSVSRDSSRIKWGIRVPTDPSQTIYVWLDALVNYLTVTGYPNEAEFALSTWPPDCHVVGKDILRFHAIYWPAFLMAHGLDLPKRILCHGHWMVNNRKMSKSIGNVIDPFECMQKYTPDGLRYFLLREGVPESDCNISVEKFSKFTNVELANTLGNLYQRCVPFNPTSIYPSYGDAWSSKSTLTDHERQLLAALDSVRAQCDEQFDAFNYYKAIQCVMARLRDANALVQEIKPWERIKKSGVGGGGGGGGQDEEIQKMLFIVYESLRVCGILLQPIVPNVSRVLLDRLNVPLDERFYEFALVDYKRDKPKSVISSSPDVIFKRI